MSTTLAAMAAHSHGVHPFAFGHPGWGVLLIPLFILIVLLVIGGILFAVFGRRWRRAAIESGRGPGGSPRRQAEATLAERFARGDIDEVEYRARLEVIRANG
ncbi:SHOCT domain-containing protein [Microbacterium sp. NPDC091313]